MYAISYHMQSGSTIHRAPNARVAVELLGLIVASGGTIEKVMITRTGQQLSIIELRQVAQNEADSDAGQPPRSLRDSKRWWFWRRGLGKLRTRLMSSTRVRN